MHIRVQDDAKNNDFGRQRKIPVCGNPMKTSCTATCHNLSAFNNLMLEAKKVYEVKTYTSEFYWFLSAAIISWIGMAVVVSIGDAICFDLLGLYHVCHAETALISNCSLLLRVIHILGYERRKDYGKQKMWGSIGFGIFGIGAGYLVDVFSANEMEKDYSCIFYIMLTAMTFDFIVSVTLNKVYRNFLTEM